MTDRRNRPRAGPPAGEAMMTISPFDHPLLGSLLGDARVSAAFAAETEIRAMLDEAKSR